MGPTPKPRSQKICPVCTIAFEHRKESVVCCSKSCARSLDAKVHGPKNWKGGINKHSQGYLKELAKGHPLADHNGYVLQHRLVMEKHLGRYLDPKERIHHKNGVRDDNRIENLELWSTDHKDPPGVRTIDQVSHLISQLTPEDRAILLKGLQD